MLTSRHLKSQPDRWFTAMADFVEVSLLDVRERNSMAFMVDIHTKCRTLREINLRVMPYE